MVGAVYLVEKNWSSNTQCSRPPFPQISLPNSPCEIIQGNRRPGQEGIPINIQIADLSGLTLTEENLEEIFKRANEATLSQPYPIQGVGHEKIYNNQKIYRPNHNGTHSARQARHLEALFSLLSHNRHPLLKTLTDEQKLNLKLAAYFLRAGRVDESSHKTPPADDYLTRSALIYQAYATKLGVSKEVRDWIFQHIKNSSKPISYTPFKKKKDIGCHSLLSIVHELDLIRCFGPTLYKKSIKSIESYLNILELYPDTNLLVGYARRLCEATGSERRYDLAAGNDALFATCSENGAYCWNQVRSVAIPNWNR